MTKDRVSLAAYLASLVAIIGYLDDTGQEYHQQRQVIAEEFITALNRMNSVAGEDDTKVTKGLKDSA